MRIKADYTFIFMITILNLILQETFFFKWYNQDNIQIS